MYTLETLEPKVVFDHFKKICEIPHGSENTKALSDYLVEFGKNNGCEVYQDEHCNVVIYKEASAGYEDADAVILQAHIDMVCQKTENSDFDFEKDAIKLAIDGDKLVAEETTLGADNGIAVAMIMSVIENKEMAHPRLECVFTSDEEVGLIGAELLDPNAISARKMINLDSEEEGIITVSCAGGVTAIGKIPVERENKEGILCTVTVDGLVGGHSGVEINQERGNAIVLMGRVLYTIAKEVKFNTVKFNGGTADNAICRSTTAEILIDEADIEKLQSIAAELDATLKGEFATPDPDVTVSVAVGEKTAAEALTDEATAKVTAFVLNSIQGIINMSANIDGLVETSNNIGIANLLENEFEATYCVRSSSESRKAYVNDRLESYISMFGGTMELFGDYPGWDYRQDSPLRDACIEVYEKMFGEAPVVEAIHAGLECGMFSGKMGGDIDAVSFGPEMRNVHTTEEYVSILSTERVWKFLVEVLKECK